MFTIQDYKIIKEIYRGRETIVYQGIRENDGLSVILKTINTEHPTLENIASLKHEYAITKDLALEGIVRFYELKRNSNRFILISEDFGGVALNNVIHKKGFEVSEFLKSAIQIAKSLSDIHENRIIHKDIKPGNIIINPHTGETKITDFSISSLLPREYQKNTSRYVLKGSFAYMSPEQTGRINRAIDYRTDLYSSGVTFYEMLTRQLPFKSHDFIGWTHCHIAMKPESPDRINPKIPKVISEIILKLLAKTAEDRYQTAYGLQVDLENCLHQFQSTATINNFIICQSDKSDSLQIPEKLYGRDSEIMALMNSFDRISNGSCEKMLVSGYSGIGKSTLVREILKPVVKQSGYFICGKYDQFQRETPYHGLIQAFHELVRQLLTESEEKINVWKYRLLESLGTNVQVVTDVIPELESIVGKQPALQEMPIAESQNRFNIAMLKFVHIFSTKEHPLVLFLDDLQWADSASLRLVQLIMSDSKAEYLLIIGAYRVNEVGNAHPLNLTIDDIKKSGILINKIELCPLNPVDINQLIADTLNFSLEAVRLLSNLISDKTQGNPFFVKEFVSLLHQKGLLLFDKVNNIWQWDLEQIVNQGITENVIELIEKKLEKLSGGTQDILKVAACIGNKFDLTTISIVSALSQSKTVSLLWEAMKEGIIISDYGFKVEDWDDSHLQTKDSNPDSHGNCQKPALFSFIHDRVRQAAYSFIPEKRRQEMHLRVGRMILQNTPSKNLEEKVFDIVNQLNYGKELIIDPSARNELVLLNQIAGKKAMNSTAYEAALNYLTIAVEMSQKDCWQSDYDLTLTIFMKRSECEYLCGNFDKAEMLFDLILRNVKSNQEKANVYNTRIILYTNQGKFKEGIELGIEGLGLFGIKLPADPKKTQVLVEYLKSRLYRLKIELAGKRNIKDFYQLPNMSDPDKLAVMSIMENLPAPSYFYNMNMFAFINLKMANLSLQYGNTEVSSFAYATYGMIIGSVFGHYDLGYEFGQLALRLNDRFNKKELRNKPPFVVYAFINHWKKHVSTDVDRLTDVYKESLERGDLIYAGYSLVISLMKVFVKGNCLDDVLEKSKNYLDFLRQIKDENSIYYVTIIHQMALCLKGLTSECSSFTNDFFDEFKTVKQMREERAIVPLHWFYIFKMQSLYIFGDYSGALNMAMESEKMIEVSLGQFYIAEHYFYYSLTLTAIYPDATRKEKEKYKRVLRKNRKKLRKWSENCPENFLDKYLLVTAEQNRIAGNNSKAMDLYDNAIESAARNEFIQNNAIANELAAIFYIANKKEKIAKGYLWEARYCYHRWGASAKVNDLNEKYANILPKTVSSSEPRQSATFDSGSSTSTTSDILDLSTIIKASQAISSEIALDRLLSKLLKILIENAGAQRGLLIMDKQDQLVIEAEGMINSDEVKILLSIPVETSSDLPVSVIKVTARTLKTIVLDNAAKDGNFTNDIYIKNTDLKSMLCLPIINQERLMGILYLENNLTEGAFTPERLQLLEILSSQAAVSMENAIFYNTLECKVEERTLELKEKSEKLELKNIEISNANTTIRDQVNEIEKNNQTLLKRLNEIKILRGLLPICANCKNIRNDNGYWEGIESYITVHTEADFSHSICPECVKELYPEYAETLLAKKKKEA